MEYTVKSDVGMIRKNNQDSYLVLENGLHIFAVADGMGGHKAGEVASAIAIQTIREYADQTEDVDLMLTDLFKKANRNILEKGSQDENCRGMGTTLTTAIVNDNLLFLGHVGDSRAYLYRNHELLQLTTDHSLVNELLKSKQITPEEAHNHPQKHLLIQALGIETDLNIEINCFLLERSDIILLCTDGLSDMLVDEEISSILYTDSSLEAKVDALVEIANAKGGIDNITTILFKPIS